ncbi:MAG TPA: hypothetical protein VJ762_13095 [Sphingobium sp.]|nr:hypothetical protein [Sphingobium sp.]
MSHKPRIPTASQSPYPLHPLPTELQPRLHPVEQERPVEARARPHRISGRSIGLGLATAAVVLLVMRRR